MTKEELEQKLAGAHALLQTGPGMPGFSGNWPDWCQRVKDYMGGYAESKPHRRDCTAEWCDIGCDAAKQLADEVCQRVCDSLVEAGRELAKLHTETVVPYDNGKSTATDEIGHYPINSQVGYRKC